MFNEFADEKHEAQANAFVYALGNFVIAFERMCDAMRDLIMLMLKSEGLKNQAVAQVIMGDKASAELQQLMGAIFSETKSQDEQDRECVKELLKSIKELTENRNILLHSNWNLGTEAAASEFLAATVRYRAKQNQGAVPEVHGASAIYLDELTDDAKRIQVLLARMQVCFNQTGFKVAEEFARPL